MKVALDRINKSYSEELFAQRGSEHPQLIIGENAFPTAIAPRNLLKNIPLTTYSAVISSQKKYKKKAQGYAVWIKKTHGGGGTSILRGRYLRSITQNPKAKLGAKGTDLFVTLEDDRVASLAEIQLLQAMTHLENGDFSELIFQDLAGEESSLALENVWEREFALYPAVQYKNLSKKYKNFHWRKHLIQRALPTLDETGQWSEKRMAPGGHGFFSYETLLSIVEKEDSNQTDKPLLSVIGNGEDLGSTPSSTILGWVAEKNIPILMITTEKTEVDKKGGQIALVKTKDNETYVTLIEQAQAKVSGQLELFEKIGLEIREEGQIGLFNTNVAVFNHEILAPKLKALEKKIGRENFRKAITPTLMENKKKQADSDGAFRVYTQLEGAMGSSLLNLDRKWRQVFGEPLVHFLNIERASRTQFFSPIKSAFDFFMLYHSDRFFFDTSTFHLVDKKPGSLPQVSLNHDFYLDVENTLETFASSEILNLESLTIDGSPVFLRNAKLSGQIIIANNSGKIFDLSGRSFVNQRVIIDSNGFIETTAS